MKNGKFFYIKQLARKKLLRRQGNAGGRQSLSLAAVAASNEGKE
jgi:hypothetical protein